ncbi:MAG TPA: hypothetical protein DCZ95_00165 [Verrucomicrobia bacterium]|nr:hypothetical protein [Verrucomicrobiota bacterium]
MNRKTIVADTHVHFYPCYNFQQVWKACVSSSVQALFLAERFDTHYFRQFQNGQHPFGEGVSLQLVPGGDAVLFSDRNGYEVLIVAGRQIVTKERLEVVALTVDPDIPDGRPTEEVLAAIHEAGGLPLLNWAPGKWMGPRGQIVASLLDRSAPGSLFVGDTTLRPAGCPDAVLMRYAARRGLSILAGSDPLPFPGEESRVGRYGVSFEAAWNPEAPVDSIRKSLAASDAKIRRIGRRDSIVSVFRRLWTLRQQKCLSA